MPHTPWTNCAGPAAALAILPLPPPRAAAPPAPQEAHILRVAQRLLRASDAAGSLALLERALAAEPHLALLHLGRAVCLARLGRDEEADEALARAMACPQADGIVAYHLASACARDGAGATAMGLLEVAVTLTPRLAPQALEDAAFRSLRDHPRFLLIVGAL